jgi:hypothetical protein
VSDKNPSYFPEIERLEKDLLRTGGPAFPADITSWAGMSLRDYFAAQALSVLNYHNILAAAMNEEEAKLQIQNAAVLSYRLADAMLRAREAKS